MISYRPTRISVLYLAGLLLRDHAKTYGPSALIGVSIILFFVGLDTVRTLPIVASLFAGGLALFGAWVAAERAWVWTWPLMLLTLIAILFTVGAAGSHIWGYGEGPVSWGVALFAWMLVGTYRLRLKETMFAWVADGVLIHAAMMMWQASTHFKEMDFRSVGFAQDPNTAGGLVGLAIIYLVLKGQWLRALFLAPALYLSGSRLVLIVTIATLTLLMGKRVIRPKQAIIILSVVALTALIYWPTGLGSRVIEELDPGGQVNERFLTTPESATTFGAFDPLVPKGFSNQDGNHSAPLKLYQQGGLVAAVAGVVLIGVGLWRRRWTRSWWLLLFMAGVGTMDYYIVMPPFSLLLVGALQMQLHPDTHRPQPRPQWTHKRNRMGGSRIPN